MSEELLSLRHLLGDRFHPLQPELILAPEFEVCAVGGMGAGKSYAACVAALRHGAKYPGARVLVARQTYDELIKTTKHLFFEIVKNKGLEKFFVRPRVWDVREGTNYARMTNGSEFFFSNLDKNLDKHKNVEYSLVFIDQLEEVDFAVYQLLLLRTRLTAAPSSDRHVIGVANDEGDNWVRRRFLTFEEPHGRPSQGATRRLIRGTSLENPHLDEGIRAQYLMLPTELQSRWVYATMDAGSSRLLPELRIIEPFDVPRHWPRWFGIDPARSTGVTCVEWLTANPDAGEWRGVLPGCPHLYNEYWEEGREAETHTLEIIRRHGSFKLMGTMDKTTWGAAINSKRLGRISVADLYVRAGLPVSPSSGDEWTRISLFQQAQKRGLTVSKKCEHLIAQAPEYRVKGQVSPMTGEPMRIISKKKFHSVDAGGYVLAMLPSRIRPVDVRELKEAFEIGEGVDEMSKRHWEHEREWLPRRRGRESVISMGVDEAAMAEDSRPFGLGTDEDESW